MANIKENAVRDFIKMIEKSWTYDRMTADERCRLRALFADNPCECAITGTYQHRFAVCHAIYDSYLSGLGYTDHNWRDPHPEEAPF